MNPSPNPWEHAYQRFETPEEEIRKFIHRLHQAGVNSWPRDARIVELFCGHGNGLHALERLGFSSLEGIDLSPVLAGEYKGSAKILVGDCRQLPFPESSRDILIVQGGLHHLPELAKDLPATLNEVKRALVTGGKFVVVEPWVTPFLTVVHALTRSRVVRKLSPKFDALAEMIHYEKDTYFPWLDQPSFILSSKTKFPNRTTLLPLGETAFRWQETLRQGSQGTARGYCRF
jgi:SAM-dependent methyltransferase